jgi:hypothetical protein
VVDNPTKPKGASVVSLRPAGTPLPAVPSGNPPPSKEASSQQKRNSSDPIAGRIEEIRLAIARQSSKTALDKAKQLHKELANDESESVLIDAYVARIEAMLAKDLATEAKALADLVVSRFPQAGGRLAQLQGNLAALTGDIATVVAPLADPNATPEKRARAEQMIRSELVDLRALANSSDLAPDHPLRAAAAALDNAFEAVTSGEVDEAALALPEVSHRSPLAGWKLLIRAIASLYQGRDEDCRRFLATIDSDCVSARLTDSIRSILAGSPDGPLAQAGSNLVRRVIGPRGELCTALRALDDAFLNVPSDREPGDDLYRQIRRTVLTCERACPELLPRLKQHISVKAAVACCPVESVIDAMGGRSVHDAYFWRLYARAREGVGDALDACFLWSRFRDAAIEEGLFAADGQEAAFLYLHMAELLRRVPPDHLADARDDYLDAMAAIEDLYEDDLPETPRWTSSAIRIPDKKRDTYFLFPERLYERACVLRSDADIYKEWLDYIRTADRRDLKPDDVALKWSAAFVRDARPLIFLAESAEQRNAFNKALKYIEQAEALGGVDPKVRRARFRLLVAKAVRHLKNRNLNLASKDFVQIDELPQSGEKDRPAFVASLRWVHALRRGNQVEAERLHSQVRGLLGGQPAADVLLLNTARKCGLSSSGTLALQKSLSTCKDRDIVSAITRTCPISADVNVEILLPAKWESLLTKWFKRSDCSIDTAGLMTMARAALKMNWLELAYYCCGHGLQKGGPERARFMFMRARSLPYFLYERRQDCLDVALALARRARDMDLVAEIAEENRLDSGPWGWSDPFGSDLNDLDMDEATLEQVITFERKTRKYPKQSWLSPFGRPQDVPGLGECQCPACRRARGETGGHGGRSQPSGRKPNRGPEGNYLFDDIFDEPEVDINDLGLNDMDMLREVAETMPEFGGRSEAMIDVIEEMTRLNGGKVPRNGKDFARIVLRNPQLQQKIAQMMLQSELDEAMGTSGAFDYDDPDDYDNEWPRRKKKRKRRR